MTSGVSSPAGFRAALRAFCLVATLVFVGVFASAAPAANQPLIIAQTGDLSPTPPTTVPGRYLVTFSPLVSESEENTAITHAGATDVSSIPALRMRAVNASDAALAALQANSAVTHVEADKVRDVQATPSDPGYTSQWSLLKIGWDNVFGSVYPSGSSTVAVLDTGVDASNPDLADQLVSGTSIVDPNSDGTTDPNGHGTEMAGIVAAATDIGLLLKASEENREQMA